MAHGRDQHTVECSDELSTAACACLSLSLTRTSHFISVGCVVGCCEGLKLTECRPGESYYQLRYALGGRLAKGIVRGRDDASRTIASWSNKFAIMHRRDDPLIGLPYAANRHKFATKFVPKY